MVRPPGSVRIKSAMRRFPSDIVGLQVIADRTDRRDQAVTAVGEISTPSDKPSEEEPSTKFDALFQTGARFHSSAFVADRSARIHHEKQYERPRMPQVSWAVSRLHARRANLVLRLDPRATEGGSNAGPL